MLHLRELLNCLQSIEQDLLLHHEEQHQAPHMRKRILQVLEQQGKLRVTEDNFAPLLEEEHQILYERPRTVGIAESCTLGGVTLLLGLHPRCSKYFHEGRITYTKDRKVASLGVDEQLIATYGICSGPVAEAMADGLREQTKCDIALSTTGAAGPEGVDGPPGRPDLFTRSGDVRIGLSTPDGTTSFKFSVALEANLSRYGNIIAFSYAAHQTLLSYLRTHS